MNNTEQINYPAPKQEYKVLVRCFTYNQSKYIEDSLNGFVMQQTNFPFACLVMDDASTDGEQDVIKSWMDRECDMSKAEHIDIPTSIVIIVPHRINSSCTFAFYFLKQNLYATSDKKMNHVYPWREKCKYEALCEGDDYWIDPYKLQQQIDFLESHDDYSICFHNVYEKLSDGSIIDQLYKHLENRTYEANEVYKKWTIPTCSVVYRTSAMNNFFNDKRYFAGDIIIFLTCMLHGKCYCFSDKKGVYRRLQSGWTLKNKGSLEFIIKQIEHHKAIKENYIHVAGTSDFILKKLYLNLLIKSILRLNFTYRKEIHEAIRFFMK